MTNGLKTAHSPFSSPFMRKFGSIIGVLLSVMERVGHHVAVGRAIAFELIGHETPRRLALLLEESSKEASCGLCVPPSLHEDIEDLTILIYGSIQIAKLSADANKDFVDEPLIAARTGSFAQPIGVGWTEANAPAPDGFVRYGYSALG
jgi:hypothetical protein